MAATLPSQAHAGAAGEAPDLGQLEGQDVSLVGPSSCIVKGFIPSSRRYLPTYLPLKRMGSSRRQGLCSHLAHRWATSDSAPRSEAVGIPEAAGLRSQHADKWATSESAPRSEAVEIPEAAGVT